MKDRMLLEITEVVDDDTGNWYVGEIEFGISGNLEQYLREYGEKGRDDILGTLDYLKGAVTKQYDNLETTPDIRQ